MRNITHIPGLLKTHIDRGKEKYVFLWKIPYLFLGKEYCFSNSALNTAIQPLFLFLCLKVVIPFKPNISKLVKNAHRFVNLRKYLCFQNF